MKKLILTAAAVFFVSGCDLPEGTDKKALADAAILTIQNFNAAGIDPIQMEPAQVAAVLSACGLAAAFYPDLAEDISETCRAAAVAAGEAA